MSALDGVLRSNAPSTLGPIHFLQQQQRLATRTGFATSHIANSSGFPPLRPTVNALSPPVEGLAVLQHSLTDSEETMPVSTRNEAAGKGPSIEIPHTKLSNAHIKMKKLDFDSFSTEINKKRDLETEFAQFKGMHERETKKLKLAHEESEKEKAYLAKENAGLVHEIQQLKKELRTSGGGSTKKKKTKSGKMDPNARKDERKKDVAIKISEFIKLVTYRTIKFSSVGDHLRGVTASIYEGIKDELKLEEGDEAIDEEEFCDIYGGYVLSQLSERRQYSQTRVKDASKEFYHQHGFLPTMDEMLDPWSIPQFGENPTEEEQAILARKETILLFYLDSFLPAAVGLEHWGPERRPIHLMTDLVEVNMDPSGKKKVMVTVTSEAFGLVVYENCRESWIATWIYKARCGKDAKVPKYDKDNADTHVYRTKFTNSKCGQVLCGGWSKEGLDKLTTYQKHIQAFRSNPEATACMEYGRNLINVQASMELKGAEKKDKKPSSKAKSAATEVNFFVIDE